MKKIAKEAKRIGNQIADEGKRLEKRIDKALVKVKLDSERDWARQALENAEKGVQEINTTVEKAKQIQLESTQQLESLKLTAPEATSKLEFMNAQRKLIDSTVQKLLDAQKIIIAQEKIAREERGKVSSIPNEVEDSEQAEIQGKAACKNAQDAAKIISDTLIEVRKDFSEIEAAQFKIGNLIEEAKNLQQQFDLTQEESKKKKETEANTHLLEKLEKQKQELEEKTKEVERLKEMLRNVDNNTTVYTETPDFELQKAKEKENSGNSIDSSSKNDVRNSANLH